MKLQQLSLFLEESPRPAPRAVRGAGQGRDRPADDDAGDTAVSASVIVSRSIPPAQRLARRAELAGAILGERELLELHCRPPSAASGGDLPPPYDPWIRQTCADP